MESTGKGKINKFDYVKMINLCPLKTLKTKLKSK